MAFQSGTDGAEPIRSGPVAGSHEERRAVNGHLATGTLACPRCDAPVAPAPPRLRPTDRLGCPYCDHTAVVRDFLSLSQPSRPARVAVRVIEPQPLTEKLESGLISRRRE